MVGICVCTPCVRTQVVPSFQLEANVETGKVAVPRLATRAGSHSESIFTDPLCSSSTFQQK